jgi:hypothetical protein
MHVPGTISPASRTENEARNPYRTRHLEAASSGGQILASAPHLFPDDTSPNQLMKPKNQSLLRIPKASAAMPSLAKTTNWPVRLPHSIISDNAELVGPLSKLLRETTKS